MKQKKFIFLSLFILIIFGGFLRLYKIKTLGTFHSDQAIELTHTLEILRGKLRLIGIKTSISEVHNGAVMYYLLAPLLWLFKYDPVAGGILQSLLSLATIPLIFILGKKMANNLTGLMAAFFVAISPLLISYSRQTLLAFYPLFFSALILLILNSLLEKFSLKKTFLLGLLLGFSLQIHYLTITWFFLALISPYFLFKKKKKKLFPFFILLISGFIAGLLPLIIFELRHDFFNTRMLFSYFQENTSTAFSQQYFLKFWPLVLEELLLTKQTFLATVSFILIIFLSFKRFLKKRKTSLIEKLCLVQFSINFVILFFVSLKHHSFKTQKAINAFIPLILLTSFSLVFLAKKVFPKKQKLILLITCLFLILINFSSFRLQKNHGEFMKEGWDLIGTQKAANIIISDLDHKAFNVAMYVDAENQGLPLRYFLEVAGKKPLGIAKYGEAEILYLLKEPEANLYKITIWELTSFGSFKIAKQWSIQNGFLLYRLEKNTN